MENAHVCLLYISQSSDYDPLYMHPQHKVEVWLPILTQNSLIIIEIYFEFTLCL